MKAQNGRYLAACSIISMSYRIKSKGTLVNSEIEVEFVIAKILI